MGNYKLSSFMICIVLISLIMVAFSLYMSDMNNKYGRSYDNDSFDAYNKLDTMTTLTQDIEVKTNIKSKTGVLDVIGDYFRGAYDALVLTKTSYDVFDSMKNKAISESHLGPFAEPFRISMGLVVLIIIVVAIVTSAVLRFHV